MSDDTVIDADFTPRTDPFCVCGYRQSLHDGSFPHACARFDRSSFFNEMVLPDNYTMANKKRRQKSKGAA